jgi:hypothetical protein
MILFQGKIFRIIGCKNGDIAPAVSDFSDAGGKTGMFAPENILGEARSSLICHFASVGMVVLSNVFRKFT